MKSGFTIIELLITLGILGLLLVMGGLSYNSLRQRVALDNAADEVVNALRTVQSWAITGQEWPGQVDKEKHCINFTTSGYTAPVDPPCGSDCRIIYDSTVIDFLASTTPICFTRLTGNPTNPPPITVQVTAHGDKTVTVEANGNIYKN